MKRSTAALAVLIILIIAITVVLVNSSWQPGLAAPAASVTVPGWKTYADEENGFVIQYPADIVTTDSNDASGYGGPTADFYLPNSYGAGTDFDGGVIDVSVNDMPVCAPESFDLSSPHYAAGGVTEDLQQASIAPYAVNGATFQGRTATSTISDSPERSDVRTVYVIADGPQCYGIMLHTYTYHGRGGTAFDQSALMPLFKQVISTFRFTASSQPSIALAYPAGGQTLVNDPAAHAPMATILWDSHNAGALGIALALKDHSGKTVADITSDAPDTGAFVWFSDPTIPDGTYRIEASVMATSTETNAGVTPVRRIVATASSGDIVISSAAPSQHPASGLQTFVDTQYGFSLQYPADFSFATTSSENFIGGSTTGTTSVAMLRANPHAYFHADLMQAVSNPELVITVVPAAGRSATSTMIEDSTYSPGGTLQAFQGTAGQFTKGVGGDAAMGSVYSFTGYSIVHDGLRYSFNYLLRTSNLGFFDWSQAEEDALRAELDADSAHLSSVIDQIVASMTFI